MQSVTFEIDVAASIGAATPQNMVATAHLPQPGAPDGAGVVIFIVPRMAHMHNFAPTRRHLWQRVADWAQMQARAHRAA